MNAIAPDVKRLTSGQLFMVQKSDVQFVPLITELGPYLLVGHAKPMDCS